MAHHANDPCNEILLDRFLNADLSSEEERSVNAHLENCSRCSRVVHIMEAMAQDLQDRVSHAARSVDFVALEKEVLTTAVQQQNSRTGSDIFLTSFKVVVAIVLLISIVVVLISLQNV